MYNNNQQNIFWSNYKWLIIIGVLFLAAVIIMSLFLISQPSQPTANIGPMIEEKKTAPNGLQAKLYLEADKLEFSQGEEFTVKILLDTNSYDITAASGFLAYDRDKLAVIKIDSQNSVLTMAAEEKNENGVVSVVRGQPGDRDWADSDDGYNGSGGLLAGVVFKALAAGETEINFVEDESRLVLDDGYGTSMEMSYKNTKIIINDK